MAYIGAPVRRKEDRRLLTGHGAYADDVPARGVLHAAFVRSPHGHARITRLDTSAARKAPGVAYVVTADDLTVNVGSQHPQAIPLPPNHPSIHLAAWRPLAREETLYVGEPIVLVVADTAAHAEDGAALVDVDFDPLPAIADADAALKPGAALVHQEFGTNVAFDYTLGSPQTDEALAAADHVVKVSLKQPRVAGMALETRSTLAQYDAFRQGLTVYASTQAPSGYQNALGAMLGLPDNRIRVITKDMGGGFGLKNPLYGEDVAIAATAWQHQCSIRWLESRSESFQAMFHGRGYNVDVTLGVNHDGTLVAIREDAVCDMGGVVAAEGPIPAISYAVCVPGPYRFQHAAAHVIGVYTNRPPTAPYRGAGRPEATFALERAVDLAAQAIGMDPAELRRRNFIPSDQFPFTTALHVVYDSGDYQAALDRALEIVDYRGLRQRQTQARAEGRLFGIGLCAFVESSAPLGWESGTVRVDRGGKVTLLTGSSPHGQGHQTTFAQIVADSLGCSMDDVEVVHGDTEAVPVGIGTFGSRSAALGGSAALVAAGKVRTKMTQIAANLLEASVDDIQVADGVFHVAGAPTRAIPFAGVAGAAHFGQGLSAGMSPGIQETEFFNGGEAFPFGTHIAVVEVDPDTGRLDIQRYVAVDDCGTVLNPLLAEGQVLGGLAQGFGQALLEEMIYDESGQLANGTLMDYAIPRARTMPTVEQDRTVTPSPNNPLGAKGVGEAGTVAGPAALVNAVMDALMPLGVTNVDMPLTTEKLWAACHPASTNGA